MFDDSGQTGRPSVDYELAATQDATWTCSSGQTVDTHAALTGTVSGLVPDTKGHVHGSLELAPPAAPSSCASETLRDVEYSDVMWTNLTAGVTWGLNGATRTFP